MAMVDYLTGSPFGHAAGSLLKRRDRNWKKALGVSLLDSFVQNLNLQKQAQNQKNIERTQEEYSQVFSNNDEIWQRRQEDRDLWRGYQDAVKIGEEAKNRWIDNEAMKRFNADAHIISQMGTNAYQSLQGDTWNEASKEAAQANFDVFRGQVENDIRSFRTDRAITSPTRTKFNEPAYRELQAQLDIYTDDPARQNVVLDTFGNIFGIHDKKRAELSLALENAQRARREQEGTYQGLTYAENKRMEIDQVTSTLNDKFDYSTTAEDTVRRITTLKNRMDNSSYDLTREDAMEALSLGFNPTAAPKLTELVKNDIPGFVETFTFVRSMLDQNPDYDPITLLTDKQRRIYRLGMGLPDDAGIVLSEVAAVPGDRHMAARFIMAQIGDEERRLKTDTGSISRQLYLLDGDFATETGKDTSSGASSVFISHVLQARQLLMKNHNLPENLALKEAFDMQLKGILHEEGLGKEREKALHWFRPEWWLNPENQVTHGHEFVDPDVVKMPIVPENAHIAAENFTDNGYMQMIGMRDKQGKQIDMVPTKGRTAIMWSPDDDDFQITFTAKPDLPLGVTVDMFNAENEASSLRYKWESSYELLP